ncbi:NADP-binding protein [Gigaspora margarita]|uniref:NADP-binding protein n=1 Tax=Gigaspora margarita TaxID=4874 RepID=A0A8H4EV21_GIGMA|nr:NADP-binding protein [Gigaspora margarita]
MQIKDRVVIITGGANGIGAALARRLILEGAQVVIGDIDKKSGQELINELGQKSSNKVNAIFVFCDVTNFNHLRQLFDTAQTTFGGVDVVCNNIGIGQTGEFYDQTDIDSWIKTIDINLNAVIKGTQLGIQYLKKRGGGVIINTASLAGFHPLESYPIYTTAKYGIVGFTQSLRDLNNTNKIRVNAIAPGFVDTNLVKESRKSSSEIVQLIDKFGYVPMDEVINAFMMAIQDDNLVGDIIMLPKKNTSQIISNSYLESMGLAN